MTVDGRVDGDCDVLLDPGASQNGELPLRSRAEGKAAADLRCGGERARTATPSNWQCFPSTNPKEPS
jgi:hypothetical protein